MKNNFKVFLSLSILLVIAILLGNCRTHEQVKKSKVEDLMGKIRDHIQPDIPTEYKEDIKFPNLENFLNYAFYLHGEENENELKGGFTGSIIGYGYDDEKPAIMVNLINGEMQNILWIGWVSYEDSIYYEFYDNKLSTIKLYSTKHPIKIIDLDNRGNLSHVTEWGKDGKREDKYFQNNILTLTISTMPDGQIKQTFPK